MRKLKKISALVIILSLLLSFHGYAYSLEWEDVPGNHGESSLLSLGEICARDEYRTIARGDFLSGGATDISNKQDGTLLIGIDTYAHRNVDRIFHTVFLDQWDEDEEDWYQVNSWNFVKSKNEVANGDLSMLLTSFTVSGYEVGKYYRVRGLHGVEYNDEVEATATETNGVLLTNRN